MSAPRNIFQVIYLMLEHIPKTETIFRNKLTRHAEENLYRAPEDQTWNFVAHTLEKHLEGRSEPWVEQALRIWRDEK